MDWGWGEGGERVREGWKLGFPSLARPGLESDGKAVEEGTDLSVGL